MKSFKNHFSLVVALIGILFSMQVYMIVERALDAYKQNLAENYSLVLVSSKTLLAEDVLKRDKNFAQLDEISAEGVVERLGSDFSKKNIELLKLALPKFYKLKLHAYPSPSQLEDIQQTLRKINSIVKIETFSKTHDTTYKLLLLFKSVVLVFALSIMLVTLLLIFKELRIWQFKHNERMSIMALFGAPLWLRSAVLFRLSIVDALIATALSCALFSYVSSSEWVTEQFHNIGIAVDVFRAFEDSLLMLGVSVSVSILLATFIVIGHKEEV